MRGDKSKAIREVLAQNGNLTNQEVVKEVKDKYNLDVQPSAVSAIRNPSSKKNVVPQPTPDQVAEFYPIVQSLGGTEEANKILFLADKMLRAANDDFDFAVKLVKFCEVGERMAAMRSQAEETKASDENVEEASAA